MKYRLASFVFALCVGIAIPAISFASTGFVDSPIWLSPASPTEGSSATLTALFHNDEQYPLSGVILFYDGTVLLGQKSVTIGAGGVATASVTFTIGAGDHTFSAQMSSLTEELSSKKYQPLALPITSASLPSYFVGKTISLPLASQASGSTTVSADPENVLLNQVDNAEQSALNAVPPGIKQSVTADSESVDSWRQAMAANLAASRDAANAGLTKVQKDIAAQTKKMGSADPSSKYIDSPLSYLKVWFFAALTFIFSTPLAFYLIAVFLAYIIIRFLFRKIVNWKQK